jgi:hypothetical protein
MKNVVTISKVYFGAEINTDYGTVKIVNLNLVEPLLQGKKNEDGDKELVEVRQLAMRMSDFERMLMLDENLAFLEVKELTEEEKNLGEREKFEIQYKHHIQVLRAAKLTIEREEIKVPKVTGQDENGNDIVEKDREGNEVMVLSEFGETKYTNIVLTNVAKRYCEHLLGF